MTFYGTNFVVFKAIGKENNRFTVAQIIKSYLNWTMGMKQKARIERDVAFLRTLPKRKYAWTTRQYSGHSYFPNTMQGGERVFVSASISW